MMDLALERALRAKGYVVDPSGSLGKGSFAEVFKATRHADGVVVAIKQIHKNRVEETSNRKLLQGEIDIMQALVHDNVVSLIDTVWEDEYICLVMDYCNGKDLAKYIEKYAPLPESTVAYFARQISRALSYLHSERIVHRDLKPQNILVHYPPGSKLPVLRIADFGFARHLTINMADTFCGSPLYMAPEVLFSEGHDEQSDLWGAGAILYQCLTTRPPFKARSIEALKKILRADKPPRIKFPEGTSSEFRALIHGLLQIKPRDRMKCVDFCRHPFLAKEVAPDPRQAAESVKSSRAASVHEEIDGAGHGDGGGIPYGDAPATPSPQNSSDSNPSFLHISGGAFPGGAAGDGGGGGGGGGGSAGQSFVVVDRDTVELNVLADNLQHHSKQRTMWADSPRWRPAIPQDEVDRFIESIGQKIRPANAIMLAAKRRVERIHTHRSIRASAPDTVTKVEALKLLNQALQLLRVGMSQVREYIAKNTDAILYTEFGGEVVQVLRDTFNSCLGEVESTRRQLPDETSLSQYRGIVVKNTEELLFEYATDLSRTALDLETTGEFPQAEVVYSRILVIFRFLRNIAEPEDEVVLHEYVASTERRLDAVKTAALARSQRTMRVTSTGGVSVPHAGGARDHGARHRQRRMDRDRDAAGQFHDSGRGDTPTEARNSYPQDGRHGRESDGAHRSGQPGSYPPLGRDQGHHDEYDRSPDRSTRDAPRKKTYPSPLAHGYLHSDDRRGDGGRRPSDPQSSGPASYRSSFDDERGPANPAPNEYGDWDYGGERLPFDMGREDSQSRQAYSGAESAGDRSVQSRSQQQSDAAAADTRGRGDDAPHLAPRHRTSSIDSTEPRPAAEVAPSQRRDSYDNPAQGRHAFDGADLHRGYVSTNSPPAVSQNDSRRSAPEDEHRRSSLQHAPSSSPLSQSVSRDSYARSRGSSGLVHGDPDGAAADWGAAETNSFYARDARDREPATTHSRRSTHAADGLYQSRHTAGDSTHHTEHIAADHIASAHDGERGFREGSVPSTPQRMQYQDPSSSSASSHSTADHHTSSVHAHGGYQDRGPYLSPDRHGYPASDQSSSRRTAPEASPAEPTSEVEEMRRELEALRMQVQQQQSPDVRASRHEPDDHGRSRHESDNHGGGHY